MNITEIVERNDMKVILKNVNIWMNFLKDSWDERYKKKRELPFKNKNLSEIISMAFETEAAIFYSNKLNSNVRNAKNDNEPDLYFERYSLSLEVKVTSTNNVWTGGEFSKRPFHYLLVSWGGKNFDEFFVCCTKIEKEEWKSNIKNNYYGTTLSVKKLKEKNDVKILFGNIEKNKVVREKI